MKTQAKFTPGPWETLTDGPGESVEIRRQSAHIATVNGVNDFPCLDHDDEQEIARLDAEMQANAALIASAPDLFSALKGLLGFLEQYPHEYQTDISGYIGEAESALLKAERTGGRE